MWIYLKDDDGECIIDPINVSILGDFVDLSLIDGLPAGDCIDLLEPAINDLVPNSWHLRKMDAKKHFERAFAKQTSLRDRFAILLESWDILFGWEGFWIPSSKNAEKKLRELMQIFQYHPEAVVHVS